MYISLKYLYINIYIYIYIYIYIHTFKGLFYRNSQRKCDRAKWWHFEV